MKLYFSRGSCALAPHIALREIGTPFELVRVSFPARRTEHGEDFTTINPKGYVPALALDDGEVLTETSTILQYVADKSPESHLAPRAGTMDRYRLMEWLNFIATELHKSFSTLFGTSAPEDDKAVVRDRLTARLDLTAKHLASHPFLLGDAFSVADPYLFTVLRWSKAVKIDLSRWPPLEAFVARVAERPAVRAAMDEQGLKR